MSGIFVSNTHMQKNEYIDFNKYLVLDGVWFIINFVIWHIEAETKWPIFRKWHIQVHFREWKYRSYDQYFTELRS